MKKILLYNSGGGLGDSIQLFNLILSLQNHFKSADFFYLGAHENHFQGKLKEFTGISDPYEDPIKAELKIDSSGVEPEKLVEKIYNYIEERGFISE